MNRGVKLRIGQVKVLLILINFLFSQRLNKLIIPQIEEDREETELEDFKGNQILPLTTENEKIEQKAS